MESMVMKLFRQLIELGVFGRSWMPILSKKYVIAVGTGNLHICRNDGPGVLGVHPRINFTHLVTLTVNGGIEWSNDETFKEHELEQVLQALVDTYPPELGEVAALGFSSMQWPNLPRLIEKLDTFNVPEAFQALVEQGLFMVNQFPMVTDDKQFAVFFSRTPNMISICKNDGDMEQHSVPGLLGAIGGFTRVCHLRNGSITWTLEEYGTKHVEDILNEVLAKFIKSKDVDPLGRGLTSEATQKLFKEQNPHMYEGGVKEVPFISPDELAREIMAGANGGMDGIGYFFMLDAEGNPVHSDGSPLSVNDGKGNLLMGGDAMAFMQKRIQAGLKPEPEDTTTPDWRTQLRAIHPSSLFPTEEERTAYIAKMRERLPGLMNEDGSWDVMALASKAQLKTGGIARARYVFGLEQQLRASFSDEEKYVAFLERMVKLQLMSPGEFMEDARRSAEELEQMYPTPVQVLDPGATIFSEITPGVSEKPGNFTSGSGGREWNELEGIELRTQLNADGHYIPLKDEPSPFHGLTWINWKRAQPDMVGYKGSFSGMWKQLLTILENEKPRSQVQRENVPDELRTSDGHLSLGYVIHIRWAANKSWKEAHDYCVWLLSNNQPR